MAPAFAAAKGHRPSPSNFLAEICFRLKQEKGVGSLRLPHPDHIARQCRSLRAFQDFCVNAKKDVNLVFITEKGCHNARKAPFYE